MIVISIVKQLLIRAGADFSGMRKEMSKAQSTVKNFSANVGAMLKKMAVVFAGVFAIKKIIEFGKASKAAADEMAVNEAKLAVIMRKRMQATDETIQSVKDLIAAQEGIGVVDVVAQTAAAQELSTYLEKASSLKSLLPTLNDLIAQQYGMAASAEQATGMATMLGKVMDGQTGALSRYGFTFTKAQEKMLKYGDEASRVALLSDIVRDSIGNMNAELGKTPQGQWKQIQYTFDAIKITVGQGLTPVLQQLLPYIKAVANALLRAAQYASAFMQSLFGSKSQVVTAGAQADAVDDIAGSYDDAGKAAKKAAGSIAGFDEINTLASQSKDDNSVDSYASSSAGLAGGIFENTSKVINEFTKKAEEATKKLKEFFASLRDSENVKKLSDAFNDLRDSFKGFNSSLSDFLNNPAVKKFTEWITNTLGGKYINARISDIKILSGILDSWAGTFMILDGLFSLDFSKMLDGFKLWAKGIGKELEGLSMLFFPHFVENIKFMWEKTKEITTAAWNAIKYILFDKWTNMVKETDWGAISSMVSAVWQTIKSNTSLAWQNIKQSVSDIWSTFVTAISWNSIKSAVSLVWTDMKRVASEEWNSMRTTVSSIWDSFLTVIKWDALKNVVSNTWRDIKQVTSNVWGELKGIISDKWDAITKIDFSGIKNAFLGIWSALTTETEMVWKSISQTIKGSVNGMIDMINKFIGTVNGIKIEIPGISVMGKELSKGFTLAMPKIPDIPHLAEGGITSGPMLAMIGDNPGGEEAVAPLDKLNHMITKAVLEASQSFGSINRSNDNRTLNVELILDGTSIGRVLTPLLNKEGGRIGGNMISVT